MMGPMMAGNSGWGPMLIFPLILLAVLVVAALTLTRAQRHARAGRRSSLDRPGRQAGDDRPAAGATPREDPVMILQERYAHGEISHAEFLHVLDQLLRAGQPSIPVTGDRVAPPAPHHGNSRATP